MVAAIEEADTFEVWPENIDTLSVFLRLQTQWRTGPAGPTGLDYAGVRAALAMMRQRIDFGDLQMMESAALAAMRAN